MKRTRFLLMLTLVTTALISHGESRAAAADFTIFLPYVAMNSSLGSLPGTGGSAIQVQNLDPTQDAQIVGDFYSQAGGAPFTINRPNVAAGTAANFYLPGERFGNGAYAAIITSDRPIAAIVRTDWYSGGDSAIYSNAIAGNEAMVPLVAKGYGGQSSLVSIQNTDAMRSRSVSVAFYKSGSTQALVNTTRSIGPGTSVTLDMDKDPDFAKVPFGTLGSMVVKNPDAPVAVQAFMDILGGKGIYAYEGAPSDRAATRLYAPLIRNDLAGTSGISVVNPGDQPVQVTVTYMGNPLTPVCAGQRQHGNGSFTIAAKGNAVFYQGNIAGLPTGDSGLPKKCFGAAVIEATGGKVLAIVNDADVTRTVNSPGTGSSAAYNAFADIDGARKVALPLFRNKHTNLDLSTGIQVMNIGTIPAKVVIALKNSNGQNVPIGAAAQQTIAPRSTYLWLPPYINGLPVNIYGSASLESDQPIVVVVNDASGNGKMDAAIYSGIKAD